MPVKENKYYYILAGYFQSRPLFSDYPGKDRPDIRKLVEQPRAQIRAGLWAVAVDSSLSNLLFFEAKVRAGMTSDLEDDLKLFLEKTDHISDRPAGLIERVRIFLRFLELQSHLLIKHGKYPGYTIQESWNYSRTNPVSELAEKSVSQFSGFPLLLIKSDRRKEVRAQSSLIRTLSGHQGQIKGLCITADGKTGISAGRYEGIFRWDLESGRCINRIQNRGQYCMDMTSDGRFVASGSRELFLYDLKNNNETRLAVFDSKLMCSFLSFSPDGSLLASGCKSVYRGEKPSSDVMAIWNTVNGECIQQFKGFREDIEFIRISHDNRYLYQGDPFRIWDINSGQCLLEHPHIIPKALSKDGKMVIDHGLNVYDVETGLMFYENEEYEAYLYNIVASDNDLAKILVTTPGDFDRKKFPIQIWDSKKGKLLKTLDGHTNQVTCISVTPDGHYGLSSDTDGTIHYWDLMADSEQISEKLLHQKSVDQLSIVQTTGKILSADSGGSILLSELNENKVIHELKGHTGQIWDMQVDPSGKFAATVSHDHNLFVWNLETGLPLYSCNADQDPEKEAEFLKKKEEELAKLKATFGDPESNKLLGISIDIENIATMLAGSVRSFFRCAALTPDGSRLLAGNDDKSIWVWDTSGFEEPGKITGHTGAVIALKVTEDGRIVFSLGGYGDNNLRAWDLEKGTLIFETTGNKIHSFALSPDNKFILTAEKDQRIHFRNLIDGQEFDAVIFSQGIIEEIIFTAGGRKAALCCHAKPDANNDNYSIHILDMKERKIQAVHAFESNHDRKQLFCVTPDGRWGINDHDLNCLEVWEISSGKTSGIYQHPKTITSLTSDMSGGRIAIGDTSGEVMVFDIANDGQEPLSVTAIRIWNYRKKELPGYWSDVLIAGCLYCGHRFEPPVSVLQTIENITKKAGFRNDQSPCLELPDEAWEDPCLLVNCPKCGGAVKFNPFVAESGN